MKKKVSQSKAAEPPGSRRTGRTAHPALAAAPIQSPSAARYKVVELSTVDEISLENTLNDWVRQGWRLDGMHFAMRESSKRPAMAFLLFTQPAEKSFELEPSPKRSPLRPLSQPEHVSADPWRRLRQLAGEPTDDESSGDPTSE
ncbi:MAG TPA: hypothetical protein VN918_01100 [Myxococcaceae bacterium]|nr:hypothetical protein [Myxococcaceae bacterium]